MAIVLVGFIALGTWFFVNEEIKIRRSSTLDSTTVHVKVYAPIEQRLRCRKGEDEPVFRDLKPVSRP